MKASPLYLAPVKVLPRPPEIKRFVGMLAMHHIYCTNKIAFIEGRSKEMDLVGVKLYGKPGRVLVEGDTEAAVRKYLGDVRKLRWSKCVEMGVFPVEEVMDEEVLVDKFNFTEEDIRCVRRNRSQSPLLTTPQVAKLESIVVDEEHHAEQHTTNNKEAVPPRRKHRHHKVASPLQINDSNNTNTTNDNSVDNIIGDGGGEYYIKHRHRPSAYLFKPIHHEGNNDDDDDSPILPSPSTCTLVDAGTENGLRHELESRGAGSLWRHINAPFSGMRPANYSKTEVYVKS